MIRTLTLAASLFAAVQASAFAAEATLEVDTDRLGDAAYVEALYAELETTATEVCKKELAGSALAFYLVRSCVSATIAENVEKIGAPLLTAYANGEPEPQQLASK